MFAALTEKSQVSTTSLPPAPDVSSQTNFSELLALNFATFESQQPPKFDPGLVSGFEFLLNQQRNLQVQEYLQQRQQQQQQQQQQLINSLTNYPNSPSPISDPFSSPGIDPFSPSPVSSFGDPLDSLLDSTSNLTPLNPSEFDFASISSLNSSDQPQPGYFPLFSTEVPSSSTESQSSNPLIASFEIPTISVHPPDFPVSYTLDQSMLSLIANQSTYQSLSPEMLSESKSDTSSKRSMSPVNFEITPPTSPAALPQPELPPSAILAELTGVSHTPRPRNIAEKQFVCSVKGCNQTFTRVFNLRAHAKTHDPTRDRPYVCTECPKSFCRQHDLDRHATVHTKVRAFRCVYCARPFTRKDAMNRHIQIRKCHVLRAVDADAGVAAAVMAAVVASSGRAG